MDLQQAIQPLIMKLSQLGGGMPGMGGMPPGGMDMMEPPIGGPGMNMGPGMGGGMDMLGGVTP